MYSNYVENKGFRSIFIALDMEICRHVRIVSHVQVSARSVASKLDAVLFRQRTNLINHFVNWISKNAFVPIRAPPPPFAEVNKNPCVVFN